MTTDRKNSAVYPIFSNHVINRQLFRYAKAKAAKQHSYQEDMLSKFGIPSRQGIALKLFAGKGFQV